MTPEIAADTHHRPENQASSTTGLTTKVVKGSVWTFGAQLVPLCASLITTPITIRLLGSEAYGVLILIGLIPAYLAFADLGMGVASTRFGSEAYGRRSAKDEATIVRTSAVLAFSGAMSAAVPIFLFSDHIISAFNIENTFVSDASVALKLTSVSFVFGILGSVLNTPQLSRLRMDIPAVTGATMRVLLAGATPLVLYLGGGLTGASGVSLFLSICSFFISLYFSSKLLPELVGISLERAYVKPLLKFGAGVVVAGIAAILLVNFEKLSIARMVSARSLAYYSVAFTFASMAGMFSSAMALALMPAFSQLLGKEKKAEFDALFERTVRISLVCILPAAMVLFVIARPFFSLWAGEDFGRESTLPFYILLLGLVFNLIAFIPHSTLTAIGRTDIHARVYWIELFPYVCAVILFVTYFGIAGAALAWSLRVIADAVVFLWLARRFSGAAFSFLKHSYFLVFGSFALLPPVLASLLIDIHLVWLIVAVLLSLTIYLLLIWKKVVIDEERDWLKVKIGKLL